jgi:hypothetical protein
VNPTDEREPADPARVPSSPFFFRLVKRAFVALVALLLALASFVPAPLQGPADPSRVPNPVKSAWFLLWTQELVSWSKELVNPMLLLLIAFAALPWWPGTREAKRARWFPGGQLPATLLILAAFALIVALTLLAAFFRGENWSLALPW